MPVSLVAIACYGPTGIPRFVFLTWFDFLSFSLSCMVGVSSLTWWEFPTPVLRLGAMFHFVNSVCVYSPRCL